MTYSQLSDIKDLGSGQFSIAVSAVATTPADGTVRRIAAKILKQSEEVEITDEYKDAMKKAGVEIPEMKCRYRARFQKFVPKQEVQVHLQRKAIYVYSPFRVARKTTKG